jgi:hypothetical protein
MKRAYSLSQHNKGEVLMSKATRGQHSQHSNGEQSQETEAGADASAAAVEATPDERYRKLTLDDVGSTFAFGNTSKEGVTVNRIDFIRSAWQVQRKSRSEITRELTRLSGKKVTYQIVFAATKGIPGGPSASQVAQTNDQAQTQDTQTDPAV